MNALHQNRFSSHQMQHHLWEFFRSSRTVEAINKQTQRQMKLRQAYMQANQSADAEGYGDPEDEDEPVAAGDDDDDTHSWSVSNADSSEDEDEHEDAIERRRRRLVKVVQSCHSCTTTVGHSSMKNLLIGTHICQACNTSQNVQRDGACETRHRRTEKIAGRRRRMACVPNFLSMLQRARVITHPFRCA